MLDNKTVGSLIRMSREKMGMTQEALANQVFTTKQAVSSWETGKYRPGEDIREKLENILKISFKETNTTTTAEEGVINMEIKQLLDINNMNDMSNTIKHFIDTTELDPEYSHTINTLLLYTLWSVIGYESYKYHFLPKKEKEFIEFDWGSIAWTLRTIIDDNESYPDDPLSDILTEKSKFPLDCNEKTKLKTKLHKMLFYIGGELFEDFDENSFRNNYPQQLAHSAENSIVSLISMLPNIDNSLITQYKVALINVANTVDSFCIYPEE